MRRSIIWLMTPILFLTLTVQADPTADSLRAIIAANSGAVVTVKLSVQNSYSMPGEGASETNDATTEALGTVVSPQGLTVVSLMNIDPSAVFMDMMQSAGGDSGFSMQTTVKSVKIVLQDEKELDAEVVLRDRDLNLAFLRPKTPPTAPLTSVDLTKGAEPAAFDEVALLSRLGQVAKRACTADLYRVAGILEKPRKTFILTGYPVDEAGGPIFTLDGRIAGIAIVRIAKGGPDSIMSDGPDSLTVILPANEVAEVAAQAPEKAPVESASPEQPAETAAEAPSAPPATL